MSKADIKDGDSRHLYASFIRLHVLHHAAQEPIYGQWIVEELGRHGYRLSPGTLYPMLHGLEARGYLRSREIGAGRQRRRLYRATARGRDALAHARQRLRELVGELLEDD